jgi:phospholipase/lecithinase/hemolysin
MIRNNLLGLSDSLQFGAPPPDYVPPQAASPAVDFSKIYAFGDSLSDAGNLYVETLHTVPTGAIYSDGRFSNGPVWVQDLAKDLGLPAVTPSLTGGTDYAFGGAETGQDPLHTLDPAIDLPTQLAEFLYNVPKPSANALYTLSIGGNDLLDAIPDYAAHPTQALDDVTTAVSNEINFVSDLALDGAHNFLILNVPNLGLTPEEAGKDAATATKLSGLYDTDLARELGTLAMSDHLSIHIVNAFKLIDNAVADPSKYGLTNVKTPVWTGNFESASSGTLNATGSAQNSYLFFDHLHPTETGHTAIANLAVGLLK